MVKKRIFVKVYIHIRSNLMVDDDGVVVAVNHLKPLVIFQMIFGKKKRKN